MDNPYKVSEAEAEELTKSPSWKFWTKILYVAIIYTVIGLAFVCCCYFNRDRLLGDGGEVIDRLLNQINLIILIIWGGITFAVSGVTSIIICLIMRSKVSRKF